MPADNHRSYLQGLVVPDPRISSTTLVSESHSTVPSSYSQAGPRPGVPAVAAASGSVYGSALELRASGAMSSESSYELTTARAGNVGPGTGAAGYLLRTVAGTGSYIGWDGYQAVTAWEALLYTEAAQGANIRPSALRLASGKLMVAYSVTTLGVIRVSTYDPSTSAWTARNLSPTNAGSGYLVSAVALCQMPSGRVLAFVTSPDAEQIDAYYTDDDGADWNPAAYRVLQEPLAAAITPVEMACAYSAGEILLIVTYDSAGNRSADQYASRDGGSTFARALYNVRGETAEEPESVDVHASPGGGFLVIYQDTQASPYDVACRRFGSAGTPWDLATLIVAANGGAIVAGCSWRDEDQALYLIFHENLGKGLYIYRSMDDGLNWEDWPAVSAFLNLQDTSIITDRFDLMCAASIGGRAALVSRWTAGTGNEDPMSVGVVWLGGQSTHTVPASNTAYDYSDINYIAWGHKSVSATPGGIWLPIEEPASVEWTETSGGGGSAINLISPGVLEVSTTAGSRYFTRALGSRESIFGEIALDIDAGDGALGSNDIALVVRLADAATYQYTVSFRFTATGFRIRDDDGAANVGSDGTADLTNRFHFRFAMDKGEVRTWYAEESNHGHVRRWTTGPAGTIVDAGATANASKIEWGHLGAATDISRWHLVAYCTWAGQWGPLSAEANPADSWTSPDDVHPRAYPSVPAYLYAGTYVQGIGGPTYYNDVTTISTAYDYPVANIFPAESPCPRRGWRSTGDNVNTALVWDLEADVGGSTSFWESSSIGIFLRNANLQNVKLQGWDGAAWADITEANASKGYTDLPYLRKGRVLYFNSGASPTGTDRWSFHDMHAGDTCKLVSGGTTVYRRIASNSEGGWRTGSKLARVTLDDELLDGTEPSSGTLTIYRRNFGTIVHNLSATYRYVRAYIPAQETADNYYAIGNLAIGPFFVFGKRIGNGWSHTRQTNVELQTSLAGSRTSRVLGPSRRVIDVSWSDQPADTMRVWGAAPAPDYVTAVDSGDPVASWVDTAEQVLGLVQRLDGSSTPVVYVGACPRGTGSPGHPFTQDQTWVYGRVTTADPSWEQVVGDEGVDAVVRGQGIRIEEEV